MCSCTSPAAGGPWGLHPRLYTEGANFISHVAQSRKCSLRNHIYIRIVRNVRRIEIEDAIPRCLRHASDALLSGGRRAPNRPRVVVRFAHGAHRAPVRHVLQNPMLLTIECQRNGAITGYGTSEKFGKIPKPFKPSEPLNPFKPFP